MLCHLSKIGSPQPSHLKKSKSNKKRERVNTLPWKEGGEVGERKGREWGGYEIAKFYI